MTRSSGNLATLVSEFEPGREPTPTLEPPGTSFEGRAEALDAAVEFVPAGTTGKSFITMRKDHQLTKI